MRAVVPTRPARWSPPGILLLLLLLLLGACSSPSPVPHQAAAPALTPAGPTPDSTATTAPPTTTNTTVASATGGTGARPQPAVVTTTTKPKVVRSTTTTVPAGFQPVPANFVPVPDPPPLPLPPTTGTTMVVLNPAFGPIPAGVEQTPPYEPPTVAVVGPVTCRANPDAAYNWEASFTATLVGGRYWLFPFGGTGNTGTFYQGVYDAQHHPDGFDFNLDQVWIKTPANTDSVSVPITPAVPVHCPTG